MSWFKKRKIRSIIRDLQAYTKDPRNRHDNIIFLSATTNPRNGNMEVEEGAINVSVEHLPGMLIQAARGDEHFAKGVIVAAESLKHNMPEMRKFSDMLTEDIKKPMKGVIDSIKRKFPDAEVMSVDITKLDDMPEEDFDKMIDSIFKATKKQSGFPDEDKESDPE